MFARAHPSATPGEILYDSPRTHLVWKGVVSLLTGLALAWFMSFLRWFAREGDLGAMTPPMISLGAVVSLVMLVSALSSKIVRRVEVTEDRDRLLLHRDPGVTDVIALSDLVGVCSEAHVGGWSRDPAEDLVLTRRDGAALRYAFPDDADTPGIVSDLRAHLRSAAKTES